MTGRVPMLRRSEPILAVCDVLATIAYYRVVLGFGGEWTLGDPPGFGCVCRGRLGVMFCHQPEIAGKVEGHMVSIFVEGVDALHAEHLGRGARIVKDLKDEPWGLREYTVRDLNGYHLRFGEGGVAERPARGKL